MDYQKITLGEAKCFHTYFQLINKEEENLSIYQNKIELINYKKLQGLESLWRITFDSENEKATEQSGELKRSQQTFLLFSVEFKQIWIH